MSDQKVTTRNPWAWIPTLYFTQGIPYVMVMSVSVMMYKNLGVSNTDIAFFTSLLYFPWFLKFAWGPFIDMFKTKRFWTTTMQFLVAIGLFGIALSLHTEIYWQLTLIVFALMAFASISGDRVLSRRRRFKLLKRRSEILIPTALVRRYLWRRRIQICIWRL